MPSFSISAAAVFLLSVASLFGPGYAAQLEKPNSKSNPQRIWDDAPGGTATFEEYYPIGNGRIGMMVSGDPRREMMRLNENSFWSGGPLNRINPDAFPTVKKMQELVKEGRYLEAEDLGVMGYTGTPLSTRHFYKMGNLKLTQTLPDGTITNYERWLGVDDAMAGAYYTVGNVTYQRDYLASYPDNIIAVRLRATVPGSINLRARIDRGSDLNRYQGWSEPANGHSTITGGVTADANPIVWAAGARISSKGGKVSTLGDTIRCEGADEATVYFQSWTSYRKADPKQAVISDLAAVTKTFEELQEAHIADYQKFFGRVSINLGLSTAALKTLKTSARVISITAEKFDPELAALYFQLGRYLLIASSRPDIGGTDLSLPPNLQGIWNDQYHPVWGSKYTVNINLQMNYWPSLVTGLSDLVAPLNNLLKTMDKRGQEVARRMYNSTGTVSHHNTDLWGDSAPQDDYIPGTFWPMGATWMITHVIEHYRFTGDKEMLRDMFPTLRGVAQFALDFVTPHKGYMVTNPSSSPENTFYLRNTTQSAAIAAGPTIDNELLWEVLGFIPEAQAALGIKDDAFAKKVADLKAKLPPLRINQYGGIAEWMEDFEEANPGNGHMSHLVPVYPLTHITSSNSTLFNAAITSLKHRLSNGGGGCGWPRAWTVALAGRLFLSDIAHQRLAGQINSECTWNRTMLNMGGAAPFQIDGSFGAPAGMVESLLQSHENVATVRDTTNGTGLVAAFTGEEGKVPLLRLLPSVPKEWAVGGGFVKGLKARGGYTVDLKWDGEGKLESAELRSDVGNEVYVTVGRMAVGGEGGEKGETVEVSGVGKGVFVKLEGRKGVVYKVGLGKLLRIGQEVRDLDGE